MAYKTNVPHADIDIYSTATKIQTVGPCLSTAALNRPVRNINQTNPSRHAPRVSASIMAELASSLGVFYCCSNGCMQQASHNKKKKNIVGDGWLCSSQNNVTGAKTTCGQNKSINWERSNATENIDQATKVRRFYWPSTLHHRVVYLPRVQIIGS